MAEMLEKEMDKYSAMGFSDMGVFWGVLAHGSESVHPSRLTTDNVHPLD